MMVIIKNSYKQITRIRTEHMGMHLIAILLRQTLSLLLIAWYYNVLLYNYVKLFLCCLSHGIKKKFFFLEFNVDYVITSF